jgi:hypothetical protein
VCEEAHAELFAHLVAGVEGEGELIAVDRDVADPCFEVLLRVLHIEVGIERKGDDAVVVCVLAPALVQQGIV